MEGFPMKANRHHRRTSDAYRPSIPSPLPYLHIAGPASICFFHVFSLTHSIKPRRVRIIYRKTVSWVYTDEWRELACRVGSGLRELLASPQDFEQAYYTCANGLLSSKPPTEQQLRIAGQRLMQDAIIPLETDSRRA